MSQLAYTPPASLVGFLTADKFINLVVGPIGSTKSTAGIMKIAYEAKRIAKCTDGVRRSRCAWIRNTNQMLDDTSIPDFLKWFPDGVAGVHMKTGKKFLLKFDDVECEVMFRGLDDANDVRRLLSLQLTFGVMDEFREINKDIFEALSGRLGRYPDKSMNKVGCQDDNGVQIDKIWGMTNPPDYGTFWEEYLSDPPANAVVYFQPSGVSPEVDWQHYLKDGYYDNLCVGKGKDWIDIYVHAKFGKSLSGQPVFRCFDREVHVAKSKLTPVEGTVLIGLDAGLNPSATFTQQTYDGRVVVYDSITGQAGGMGALRFIREMFRPLIVGKYKGNKIMCVIDPAAFQRAQTDERSVADIFKAEGFTVVPALTNTISARIGSGEKYMTMSMNGNPGLLIDPGCTQLIQAMSGKYKFKTNAKGETNDLPEKLHPWSDLCLIAGTVVKTPSGDVPIESLRVGDVVCVPDGFDVVVAVGNRVAPVIRLDFDNGASVTCTPDHPFAINNNTCFSPANALTYDDNLVTTESGIWANGRWRTLSKNRFLVIASSVAFRLKHRLGAWLKGKVNTVLKTAIEPALGSMTGLLLTGCGSQKQGATIIIGQNTATKQHNPFTNISGSATSGLFQKDTLSTTSTVIHPTTRSRTLSAYSIANTVHSTCESVRPKVSLNSLKPQETLLQNGTPPQRDWLGTKTTLPILLRGLIAFAWSAVQRTTRLTERQKDTPASPRVIKHCCAGSDVVYNLTVGRTHTYYANGFLTHNCDSLTYATLHHDKGAIIGRNIGVQAHVIENVDTSAWT